MTGVANKPAELIVETTGKPVSVCFLAKLLLKLHHTPRLTLVHDESSGSLPPKLKGPLRHLD